MGINIGHGAKAPEEFNVIIEIPANTSPVKYEMDKASGLLSVDRFISTGMSYPANYGFIPDTLSLDGDPSDVLVITPFPVVHGANVVCRAIGMLAMEDESGVDTKIIALPTKKICPMYANINTLEELPGLLLEQIKHFFENYKSLEAGKWVKVQGYKDAASAKLDIEDSMKRFTDQ